MQQSPAANPNSNRFGYQTLASHTFGQRINSNAAPTSALANIVGLKTEQRVRLGTQQTGSKARQNRFSQIDDLNDTSVMMTAKSRPVSQEDNDKLSAFTSALASTDMHKTAYLTHRERSKWVPVGVE